MTARDEQAGAPLTEAELAALRRLSEELGDEEAEDLAEMIELHRRMRWFRRAILRAAQWTSAVVLAIYLLRDVLVDLLRQGGAR